MWDDRLALPLYLPHFYVSLLHNHVSLASLSLLSFSLSSPSSLLSLSFLLYLHSLSLSFSLSYLFLSLFVCLKPNHLPLSPISPPPSPSSPPSAHHRPLLAAPFPSQLIVNEFDGPREATPAGTRLKASGSSKCSAPPETPRNQSKAPIISNTPECEKHVMLPISNLPWACGKHWAPCSVCKWRSTGRAPKVAKYCVACSDIPTGKACVCVLTEARSGGSGR